MSGIAGLIHTDGRPASRDTLGRMLASMRHRGPDGLHVWTGNSTALGHAKLATTSEALLEHQPLENETGHLVLVFDGRLDNRDELRAAVAARDATLRDPSDAELALKTCIVLGDEAPSRMVGDFAFAFWDARRRRLFCARDALGQRPFVYAFNGRTFRFASEICAILCDTEFRRVPNEGMAAEFLACAIASRSETLYQGIERLPPAHFMVVETGRVQLRQYWDVQPDAKLHLNSDAAYAERFRELFTEAVRCRMRSHRPLAAHLSGGLDSSSVVSVAAKLRDQGTAEAPGIETFSMVFPGMECDESAYSRDVAHHARLLNHALMPNTHPTAFYEQSAASTFELPDYPNGAMAEDLKNLASQRKARVILTGMGGDDWFDGSYYAYTDGLRTGSLLSLASWLLEDAKTSGFHKTAERLMVYGFYQQLPETIRGCIRRMRQGRRPAMLLRPEFLTRSQLEARTCEPDCLKRFSSRVCRSFYGSLHSGWMVHALEMEERSASLHGLELRSPFHDRRLVEFAFSLPDEQRWRGGLHRLVVRNALKDTLPESVRLRGGKVQFTHVFLDALNRAFEDNFAERMEIVKRGWIDPSGVKAAVKQMQAVSCGNSSKGTRLAWSLWMVFAVEWWYKHSIVKERNLALDTVPFETRSFFGVESGIR